MSKWRRIHKLLALMLVVVLVGVTGIGCSSQEPPAAEEPDTAAEEPAAESDYPNRPITMIVPFGPGGATDQIGRTMAAHMEKTLGTTITVTNMAGGASAIGNEYVMNAKHDGYTVLVEPTDITSIAVMGQSNLTYRDWTMIGVAAAVPTTFVVNKDSDIQTLKDLEAALKSEKLSIATSDSGCAFTRSMGLFCNAIGAEFPTFVPSGGGGPAAVSAVKNEVDGTACGLPEAIEYIRGGQLRSLCVWSTEDVEVEGYGTIPSVANDYPDLADYLPNGGWVGMAVPNDVPDDVVAKLTEAFEIAYNSDEFQTFCKDRFFAPVGLTGDEAVEYVANTESINAWLLYDMGLTAKSPEEFGIKRLGE